MLPTSPTPQASTPPAAAEPVSPLQAGIDALLVRYLTWCREHPVPSTAPVIRRVVGE